MYINYYINSSPVEVHRYTLTPSFIDYLSTNKLPLSYSILSYHLSRKKTLADSGASSR